jgi:predicted  nucleic acid-binding Zn-ribbon protein
MQAVNVELDLARSILAKEEADWIRLAEQVASGEAQVQEGEKRLGMLQEAQVTARAEIGGRQEAAMQRRQVALTARDSAAAAVEQSLRTRYERLRKVKSVTVVVALSGAACGSCFTTVPLNRRSQMRAGMLIDSCESCGVILYADDDVG